MCARRSSRQPSRLAERRRIDQNTKKSTPSCATGASGTHLPPMISRIRVFASAGAAFATFLVASGAWAAPSVSIVSPATGATVRGNVVITANIARSGTPAILSAKATLAGVTKDMTFQSGTTYTVSFPTKGVVPWGPQTVTVTATDSAPSSASASIALVHDELAELNTLEFRRALYVPTLSPLKATCVDDGPTGCALFEFIATPDYNKPELGTVVASSTTGAIDTVLDLTAYADQGLTYLMARMVDGAGQVHGPVYVSAGGRVTDTPPLCRYAAQRLDARGNGYDVLDADDDRVLYNDAILDRKTNVLTDLPGVVYERGALLAGGAVVARSPSPSAGVFFLPGGSLVSPSDVLVRGPISVFGRYVAITDTAGRSVYDTGAVADGQTFKAATSSVALPLASVDPSTGELCTWSANNIVMKKADGSTRTIALDPSIAVKDCAAGGGNIVYRFTTTTAPGPTGHLGLNFRDAAGTTTVLVPESFDDLPGTAGESVGYDISGDWVAYKFAKQVYRRDPAGVVTAISPVQSNGSGGRIYGISPTGEVLLTYSGGVHRIKPGEVMGAATQIATLGFAPSEVVRWRNGTWHIMQAGVHIPNDGATHPFDCFPAGSLPPPAVDGGVPDASAPDSGSPDASSADAGADGGSGSSSSGSTSSSGGTEPTGSGGGSSSGAADPPGGAPASPADDGEGGCNVGHGSTSLFPVGLFFLGILLRRRGAKSSRHSRP